MCCFLNCVWLFNNIFMTKLTGLFVCLYGEMLGVFYVGFRLLNGWLYVCGNIFLHFLGWWIYGADNGRHWDVGLVVLGKTYSFVILIDFSHRMSCFWISESSSEVCISVSAGWFIGCLVQDVHFSKTLLPVHHNGGNAFVRW